MLVADGKAGQESYIRVCGNRLADLLYRFTGFPARFSALLLKFPGDAFSFAFGLEFRLLDQFPSLVLDRARNLFPLPLISSLFHIPVSFQSSDPCARIGLLVPIKTCQTSVELKSNCYKCWTMFQHIFRFSVLRERGGEQLALIRKDDDKED